MALCHCYYVSLWRQHGGRWEKRGETSSSLLCLSINTCRQVLPVTQGDSSLFHPENAVLGSREEMGLFSKREALLCVFTSVSLPVITGSMLGCLKCCFGATNCVTCLAPSRTHLQNKSAQALPPSTGALFSFFPPSTPTPYIQRQALFSWDLRKEWWSSHSLKINQ